MNSYWIYQETHWFTHIKIITKYIKMDTWRTKVTTVPSVDMSVCCFCWWILRWTSRERFLALLLGLALPPAEGAAKGGSRRALPAWKVNEGGSLGQVTWSGLLGLILRREMHPWDFLYYSACCKEVGHYLDQSDRQYLELDLQRLSSVSVYDPSV